MQRRSHPFLSRPGCAIALLLVLALVIVVRQRGGLPFSPGRLAAVEARGAASSTTGQFTSHAQFEADCQQCHTPWRGIEAARCEQCHQGVARQRAGGLGLHGRFAEAGRCARCHTDHRGEDATLTIVSPDIFDHDATAFSLVQHQLDYDGSPLACRECHAGGDYSGATTDCVTCHTDARPAFMAEHRNLFGPACADCHDGLDTMAAFEHAQVFVLDGAHATTACIACHAGRVFAGTPAACEGCHAEPAVHAGLFGLDCAGCHSTAAWLPATMADHTFPLDHGRSGVLTCATCHETSLAAYTCYNCHEHEPDDIAEEHLDEGIADFAECAACHPTGNEDEAKEIWEGRGD